MSPHHDPSSPPAADGYQRLVHGLARLGAETWSRWETRLNRFLETGIEALSATGAVVTRANEDHHWVVAAVGESGHGTGDRIEPGTSALTAPFDEGGLVVGPGDSCVGAPILRDGTPWGSLSFLGVGDDIDTHRLSLLAQWLSREVTIRYLEAEVHRAKQHLGHLVHIDPLTELFNRRGAAEAFDGFVRRSGFEGKPLSWLICGLSGMQKINGRFGRPTGDRVVRAVARTLRQSLRPGDVSARIGRYELLGILPGASLTAARAVAERVLERIDDLKLATPEGEPVLPTVRIGVARVTLAEDSFEDVERHVGPLLREAHRSGEVAVANGLSFLQSAEG